LLFATVVVVGFFVGAELLLGLLGFKPVLYERDPYVGFSSQVPLFVRDTNSPTADALITAPNKRRFFNVQRFTARKPRDTVRIFCLGGSTTYGHPYEDPTSFAGWLRATLPKADPSRPWEVINCGGISYASYREALLMEELVQYQPDLFIVLSGQNEFLEQRTYSSLIAIPEPLRGAGALLSRTRIYAALERALGKSSPAASVSATNHVLPSEVETRLERVVGPQAYHRDEALARQIMGHFRFNLSRMMDIAQSVGARVIFVAPASNLRHCSPFKSEHRAGLTEAELKTWQSQAQRARQSAGTSQWAEALAACDQALAIDDRYADLHYLRGHALWQAQRFAEAKAAFVRARDEDVCPLRALSPMLDIVAEVAQKRSAPFVDFARLLEEKAEHATPGDDWFLDHVHPSIEGNRVLSLALLEVLIGQGVVRPAANWNESAALTIQREVESQLTPKNHSDALVTLAKVIAWAGKHEEALRISLRAVQLAPEDPLAHFEAGKNASQLGQAQVAQTHLQRALALRPGFVEAQVLLGSVLAGKGQFEDAIRQAREALARRPDDPELHASLGTLLARERKHREAAASFREAVRLSPGYAEGHSNLAWVLKDMGEFTEALAHFREAVQLKPGLPSPSIGLAWLLATHPDEKLRNPSQAIQLGETLAAQSEYNNWMSLDALAAAYASAGRFDEAVSTAQKAVALVKGPSPADESAVRDRLRLYQSRKPYRETAPAAP
jgi:tetratricopeptide (TPR) repeat protein